jgi:DGQHR domain-containing protein
MKHIEVKALEVEQSGYRFYVGVCSAKRLLAVAYVQKREGGEGVQRILAASRLKEIGNYVRQTEPPGLLPNTIILGLSEEASFIRQRGVLRIPDREREAFVVDGQHRLFAFQDAYVGDFDIDLPITAFIGLPIHEIAYLFRTINSTQRKINPSLVYDLIPYLRQKEWVSFEDSRAQFLVQELGEDKDSPWYRGIAMLGGRNEPITQASFVTAIKRLLKTGEVLSSDFLGGAFAAQEMQYQLLLRYFNAVAEVFAEEWRNPEFVVSKNLGVSALLNLLGPMLAAMESKPERFFRGDELSISEERFVSYLRKARRAATWRRSDMAKSYLGAAGIRTLTEELRDAAGLL